MARDAGRIHGIHISRHIRSAESIDGLLGIPHHDQHAIRIFCLRGEHLGKDLPLGHIGVLEFINQYELVLAAQLIPHRIARITRIQNLTQDLNHVIEAQRFGFATRCNDSLAQSHGEFGELVGVIIFARLIGRRCNN